MFGSWRGLLKTKAAPVGAAFLLFLQRISRSYSSETPAS